MSLVTPTPAKSPAHDPGSAPCFPDLSDLLEQIHFAPNQGRIWLDKQRMVLLHTSALGVLRSELIASLGTEQARGLLTRIGYNSGSRDAELTRTLRTSRSRVEAIYVGAQLHMLEGVARVEPVRTEINAETGHFFGEFLWHGSAEGEEHMHLYGLGIEPACWMQAGYASGFASVFMGRPILFRELECVSQGAAHCRIVGRPVDEWGDGENERRFMQVDTLTSGLSAGRNGLSFDDPATLNEPPGHPLPGQDVVGASAGFNAVCHMLRRVADTQATVLMLGESGVGKEVLARALHRISLRASQPFVALNCAAIPEDLIEAELFGIEPGAYTGATVSRPGRFERASKGTLFLDEIGILSRTAQGKLLRALQEHEIERLGDTRVRKVDVRVLAATNVDLRAEVEAGRFREDLFYRLNVFPIRVPPLRERREDIPIFMNHFLRKFNLRNDRSVRGFTPRAIEAMLSYEWPGNVRELENLIERGVILAPRDGVIDTVHLFVGGEKPPESLLSIHNDGSLRSSGPPASAQATASAGNAALLKKITALLNGEGARLKEIEDLLLQNAVDRSAGNLSAAARRLGISRPKLEYRLKKRSTR